MPKPPLEQWEGVPLSECARRRYPAWLADVCAASVDLHALPRVFWHGHSAAPRPRDLAGLVAETPLIVVGEALRVDFSTDLVPVAPSPPVTFADVMVGVEQVLKGESGSSLLLRQVGGPKPDQTCTRVVLEDSPDGFLLLPGERALLFLVPTSNWPGRYITVSWHGLYRLADGGVQAMSGAPLPVTDMSEQDLIDTIRSLANR